MGSYTKTEKNVHNHHDDGHHMCTKMLVTIKKKGFAELFPVGPYTKTEKVHNTLLFVCFTPHTIHVCLRTGFE